MNAEMTDRDRNENSPIMFGVCQRVEVSGGRFLKNRNAFFGNRSAQNWLFVADEKDWRHSLTFVQTII